VIKFDLERFGNAADQRKEFVEAFTPFAESTRVMRNRILVGTYVQTTKTKGGIIIPQKTQDESRFQGKVGVVLKLGNRAFKWDETTDHIDPEAPKLGDWVFYRASDSWECAIGPGIPCRFIFDDSIVGVIDDPSAVW
jgi:co-chaperonin GroES (HSP10)